MKKKKYSTFTRFKPAMEADDVSTAAINNQKSLLGPTSNTNREDEEDDIENSTDILGTKSSSTSKEEQNNSDLSNESDFPAEAELSADGENNENEDSENSDDSEEDNMKDYEDGAEEDNINSLTQDQTELNMQKKEILRKNMILLYNNIHGNIDILKETNISVAKKEDIQVLNSIIENLEDSNRILFECITNDYKSTSYSEALKKYIGVHKIYDISIAMLYKHFDNMKKTLKGVSKRKAKK